MTYIDGFVLPVPTKNIPTYKKMALAMGKFMIKCGALQFRECKLVNAKPMGGMSLSFVKGTKAKKGETVFFSYIVYKSKAHQKVVMAKVMKAPGMDPDMKMPFDIKRMMVGGFEPHVDLRRFTFL